MSKTLYSLVLPVALLLIAGVGVLRLYTNRGQEQVDPVDRTIVLEAKDGRFVRDGNENPELTVHVGETVRLVFRNTDAGVVHSFTVPSQTEHTYEVPSGTQSSVVLQFRQPGQYRYTCPHHTPFMEGQILVKESSR